MPRPSPTHAYSVALIALGKTVRGSRKNLGWSQEELAHRASVDRAYISGIERGEHNVAVMNLVKIAGALEMKLAVLFTLAEL